MNILLYGFPSWTGKEPFSFYAGVGLRLPSAKRLGPYRASVKDTTGIGPASLMNCRSVMDLHVIHYHYLVNSSNTLMKDW